MQGAPDGLPRVGKVQHGHVRQDAHRPATECQGVLDDVSESNRVVRRALFRLRDAAVPGHLQQGDRLRSGCPSPGEARAIQRAFHVFGDVLKERVFLLPAVQQRRQAPAEGFQPAT